MALDETADQSVLIGYFIFQKSYRIQFVSNEVGWLALKQLNSYVAVISKSLLQK